MLVIYPNELLKTESEVVTKFDRKLMDLVRDMWSIVDSKSNPGVGLAAIQIGVPKRVIAIDSRAAVSTHTGHIPTRMIMVNPVIKEIMGFESLSAEGCLSFPGKEYMCRRHMDITVSYQNLSGKQCEIRLKGLNAVIAQHEIDHTNGITMVQRSVPDTTGEKDASTEQNVPYNERGTESRSPGDNTVARPPGSV